MLVTRTTGRCSSAPGRGLGDDVRDAGGTALGHDDRSGAGRMRGAHDGAQVVRIFHAVEHHEHLAIGHGIQVGVLARRAQGDHALMGRGTRQAVQRRARFEAHGNLGLARQVDDLLQARAAGALRDQDALQRIAGAQGFGDRMNAAQQGHGVRPREESPARC